MTQEPRDPAARPAVEPELAPTSGRSEFPCRNCGANMIWDPAVDALACGYCGASVPVPRAEGRIVERGLDEVDQAQTGFGADLRVTKCGNCGARVTFDGTSTSEACVYCGSANVLAQEANRNGLRPESLVPLDVCKDGVAKSFREWLKGRWFRPNDLERVKSFDGVGVYVPFWTFDARIASSWSADAGYYEYETRMRSVRINGKMTMRPETVRRVRWQPAWGNRDDTYDDFLVHASKGLSKELVAKLGGFDTKGLVPYRPEYLAGWRAEEYDVDLEGGWAAGQTAMVELQNARCAGDVPGDTHRNLRVQNSFSGVRWKHVLLPIWSLQYRFRGKTYTVLINGQTGRVAGEAPLSWIKVSLFVIMLALIAAAFYAIAAS